MSDEQQEPDRLLILTAEEAQYRELTPLFREAFRREGAVFCEAREDGKMWFGVLSKGATRKVRQILAKDRPGADNTKQ